MAVDTLGIDPTSTDPREVLRLFIANLATSETNCLEALTIARVDNETMMALLDLVGSKAGRRHLVSKLRALKAEAEDRRQVIDTLVSGQRVVVEQMRRHSQQASSQQ